MEYNFKPAAPGVYQPTPPGNGPPSAPNGRYIRPFGGVGKTEVWKVPPPDPTKPGYEAEVLRIYEKGAKTGSTRTAEETEVRSSSPTQLSQLHVKLTTYPLYKTDWLLLARILCNMVESVRIRSHLSPQPQHLRNRTLLCPSQLRHRQRRVRRLGIEICLQCLAAHHCDPLPNAILGGTLASRAFAAVVGAAG